MSRRGNCWDNAPQESFFEHMKDEIDLSQCKSLEDVKLIRGDWIDYYNNENISGSWLSYHLMNTISTLLLDYIY